MPNIVVIGAGELNLRLSEADTGSRSWLERGSRAHNSRMHELSLIGSVLRIVEEQAVAKHFQRVISVCLGVEVSNVEIQALVFCFGIETGSLANARLCIQMIPGQAWCEKCKKSVHIALRTDPCPHCGIWGLSVTDGDQITIRELEVE